MLRAGAAVRGVCQALRRFWFQQPAGADCWVGVVRAGDAGLCVCGLLVRGLVRVAVRGLVVGERVRERRMAACLGSC